MTRSEYKQLSHDIRKSCRDMARWNTEKTGKTQTTRGNMHNIKLWVDNTNIDKYGNPLNKYECVGDYDTGLVWGKVRTYIILDNLFKEA